MTEMDILYFKWLTAVRSNRIVLATRLLNRINSLKKRGNTNG